MSGRKKGFHHSPATKEKIREKRIKFYADGGKAVNGMKGKKHKPESLKKMRQSNILHENHKNFGDTSGSNNPAWKGGLSHVRETRIKYRLSHPWNDPYFGSRARAKRLKIPHTITALDFKEWYIKTPKICAYCDNDLTIKLDRMRNLSIDRKYNKLGYTLKNICFACTRCNTVKGNVFTFNQMREIAQKYLKITSS